MIKIVKTPNDQAAEIMECVEEDDDDSYDEEEEESD